MAEIIDLSNANGPPNFEEIRREVTAHIQCAVAPAFDATQNGLPILVGRCPNCRAHMGMSGGEGKQVCPRCHTWLEFKRVTGPDADKLLADYKRTRGRGR